MKGRQSKLCAECGTVFERNRHYGADQWQRAKYCSKECFGKAFARDAVAALPPLRDAFESRVLRVPDGCWLWQGTIDGYGYGVLDYGGKRYRAHVLALKFDGRPVPDGMHGCHHCDNPPCVRPDHLYPGTPAENVRDSISRGRHSSLHQKDARP